MRVALALFVTFSFILVVAGNYYFFFGNAENSIRERVVVSRVIDGDTVELEDGRTIRLLNINTPEKNEPFSTLSKEYLALLVNRSIEIEITGKEKYGRDLGRIYAPEYVNLVLVEEGYASPFLVSESEKKEFREAMNMAFENEEGIWNRSTFYGCIEAEINKKEEYVIISSNCPTNIKEWVIKDESRKRYILNGLESKEFVLYSGKGSDNATARYWNQQDVWNNDADSIFIRDAGGNLVYFYSYGY